MISVQFTPFISDKSSKCFENEKKKKKKKTGVDELVIDCL